MKRIIRKIALLIFLVGFFVPSGAFAVAVLTGRLVGGRDYVPEPRLVAPLSEEVVLTGKGALQFKWSPHEGMHFTGRHYDFRIYSGHDMVASALIFKKKVPGDEFTVNVNSDLFENGHVYTWSLRQVYRGVGKSRRNFYSFRVIK